MREHNDITLQTAPLRGRFAPSPTGRMHAGNIYSVLVTWLFCHLTGGAVVLRIEDLDPDRSRQSYINQVQRDFELLGLTWDEGPYYQHNRSDAYESAFKQLHQDAQLYPCFCSRADLKAASAPHQRDRWVYSGTCRFLNPQQQGAAVTRLKAENRVGPAWRLALPEKLQPISVSDLIQGRVEVDLCREVGDFILRRADGVYAYQLAVVVDDAAQGVNFVSRGMDLLSSSPQQRYLQQLLGLPEVVYAHMPLLCAADGRRLAKRDADASFDQLLEAYHTPAGIIGHIAYVTGILPEDAPVTPEQLLDVLTFDQLVLRLRCGEAITWQ